MPSGRYLGWVGSFSEGIYSIAGPGYLRLHRGVAFSNARHQYHPCDGVLQGGAMNSGPHRLEAALLAAQAYLQQQVSRAMSESRDVRGGTRKRSRMERWRFPWPRAATFAWRPLTPASEPAALGL